MFLTEIILEDIKISKFTREHSPPTTLEKSQFGEVLGLDSLPFNSAQGFDARIGE